MRIAGIQKLTALDFPDTLACTLFLDGCNLRCPFCHNASVALGKTEPISQDEILAFLKKRQGILSGVCISGGEPLLQEETIELVKKIKELGYKVKLDTNGAFPERLLKLIDGGLLDYVAMDIKNCPEKYDKTCGKFAHDKEAFFEPYKQSIEILMQNRVPYEFRTTVVNELHSLQDIEAAAKIIKGAERWYLQCFKDSGDLISGGFTPPSRQALEEMLKIAHEYVKTAEIRGI